MRNHLDIGQAGLSGPSIALLVQNSGRTSGTLFQPYLDKQPVVPPEKLTPDAMRTLAANMISALDRASMHTMFFDSSAQPGSSDSDFLSTDLFMAMRNAGVMPVPVVQEPVAAAGAETMNPDPKAGAETAGVSSDRQTVKVSDGGRYASIIARAAAANGLDPKLIEAVVQTESAFNAQAVSPVGAQGLMQLMPATADELGVTNAFNPEENIQAGSKYLKQLMDRYDGDTRLALAAYNWGMGNLERNPERMPQETINYVAKITGLMNPAA